MSVVELFDVRGRPVRQGDTIVYAGRQGSSLWLRVAQVRNIEYLKEEPIGLIVKATDVKKPVRLTSFETIAVVER